MFFSYLNVFCSRSIFQLGRQRVFIHRRKGTYNQLAAVTKCNLAKSDPAHLTRHARVHFASYDHRAYPLALAVASQLNGSRSHLIQSSVTEPPSARLTHPPR